MSSSGGLSDLSRGESVEPSDEVGEGLDLPAHVPGVEPVERTVGRRLHQVVMAGSRW